MSRPFRTIKNPAGKGSVSRAKIRSAVKFATTAGVYSHSATKSRAGRKATAGEISAAIKKPSFINKTPLFQITSSQEGGEKRIRMTKGELIAVVAKSASISKKAAGNAIDSAFANITRGIKKESFPSLFSGSIIGRKSSR